VVISHPRRAAYPHVLRRVPLDVSTGIPARVCAHTHHTHTTHIHVHTHGSPDELSAVPQPLRPYHPNYYPEKLYLYTGPETDLYGHGSAITEMKGILRQNHPETYVKTFGDLRTATLRAATWDNAAHVIVFPPFTEYPDLHMVSKTDLRGYASSGNTIVFMGGFGSVAVMNEIFGWSIRPVSYQEGPFYRSKRNAHNTVFDGMPSLLESGREPIYGVHMSTLPPGARSYYDSIGDCVVFAVRYDLGMVAYVASTMEERQGHGKWHQVLRAAVAI